MWGKINRRRRMLILFYTTSIILILTFQNCVKNPIVFLKGDSTGPIIELTEKPSKTAFQYAKFGFIATEIGTGKVDKYECSLDGLPFEICQSPMIYDHRLNNKLLAHAQGEKKKIHQFQVRSYDDWGNLGQTISHQWEVDLEEFSFLIEPQLDLTQATNSEYIQVVVSYNMKTKDSQILTENMIIIDQPQVKIVPHSLKLLNEPDFEKNLIGKYELKLVVEQNFQGAVQLKIAKDTLFNDLGKGNLESVSSLLVDRLPPQLTVIDFIEPKPETFKNQIYYTKFSSLNLKLAAEGASHVSVQDSENLCIHSPDWKVLEPSFQLTGLPIQLNQLNNDLQNLNYMTVKFKDTAGNQTDCQTIKIIHDDILPIITGLTNEKIYQTDLSRTVAFQLNGLTDKNEIIGFSYVHHTHQLIAPIVYNNVNSQPKLNTSYGASTGITDNMTYYNWIKIKDIAGNISVPAVSTAWIADASAPSKPVLQIGSIPEVFNESPILTWSNSTDGSGSGLSHYEVKMIDINSNTVVQDWLNLQSGQKINNIQLSGLTSYKISIRAVDKAGNNSIEDSKTYTTPVKPFILQQQKLFLSRSQGQEVDQIIVGDKKYIYGSFKQYTTNASNILNNSVVLNANGAFKSQFYLGDGFDTVPDSVFQDQLGSYYAIGNFKSYNGQILKPNTYVVKLKPDGQIDNSFMNTFSADGAVRKIVKDIDGDMILIGSFNKINGQNRYQVAKLKLNGEVQDLTFASVGQIHDLAVRSDGKYVVANINNSYTSFYFYGRNGQQEKALGGFQGGSTARVLTDSLNNAYFFVRGKNLWKGAFSKSAVKVSADGVEDANFSIDGDAIYQSNGMHHWDVQIDSKDRIYISTPSNVAKSYFTLLRLTSTGAIDSQFQCPNFAGSARANFLNENQILLYGLFSNHISGKTYNNLAVVNDKCEVDSSIQFGVGTSGQVRSVHKNSNGDLHIFGDIDLFNQNSAPGIIRVSLDDAIDPTFITNEIESRLALLPGTNYGQRLSYIKQVVSSIDLSGLTHNLFILADHDPFTLGASQLSLFKTNMNGSVDIQFNNKLNSRVSSIQLDRSHSANSVYAIESCKIQRLSPITGLVQSGMSSIDFKHPYCPNGMTITDNYEMFIYGYYTLYLSSEVSSTNQQIIKIKNLSLVTESRDTNFKPESLYQENKQLVNINKIKYLPNSSLLTVCLKQPGQNFNEKNQLSVIKFFNYYGQRGLQTDFPMQINDLNNPLYDTCNDVQSVTTNYGNQLTDFVYFSIRYKDSTKGITSNVIRYRLNANASELNYSLLDPTFSVQKLNNTENKDYALKSMQIDSMGNIHLLDQIPWKNEADFGFGSHILMKPE